MMLSIVVAQNLNDVKKRSKILAACNKENAALVSASELHLAQVHRCSEQRRKFNKGSLRKVFGGNIFLKPSQDSNALCIGFMLFPRLSQRRPEIYLHRIK